MPKFRVTLDDGNSYDLEAERQPTPDEAAEAIQGFHDRPTFEGAAGREAARSALPLAGGMLGASLAAAPFTGGGSLLLPLGASLIGGIAGYTGFRKGQDVLAEHYAPNSMFGSTSQQEDVKYQPGGTLLGGLLPAGIPSPTGLWRAGTSLLTNEGRSAIQKVVNYARVHGVKEAAAEMPEEYEALSHAVGIFGNAGIGAAQGVMEGQQPSDVALNTAGMMLFNKGWLHHPDPFTNAKNVAMSGFREPPEGFIQHQEYNLDGTLKQPEQQESGQQPPPQNFRFQPSQEDQDINAQDRFSDESPNSHLGEQDPFHPTVPAPDDTHLEDMARWASESPAAHMAEEGADKTAEVAPLTSDISRQIAESSRDHAFVESVRQDAEDRGDLHDVITDERQKSLQRQQDNESKARDKAYQTLKKEAEQKRKEAEKPVKEGEQKKPQPTLDDEIDSLQKEIQKMKDMGVSEGPIRHNEIVLEEKIKQKANGTTNTETPTGAEEVRPDTTTDEQTPKSPQQTEPEVSPENAKPRIVAATFDRGGTTFEGTNHNDARKESGLKKPVHKREARQTPQYGFTVQHSDGITEVVSREQAHELAQKNGQLKDDAVVVDNQLHTDHVKDDFTPDNERQTPHMNDVKDELDRNRWESKEEFDAEYVNDHYKEGDFEESPKEFILRKFCGG